MPSTSQLAHDASPAYVHDDNFNEWRAAFHIRLKSERTRFATLSAALACAEDDPVKIFHDLREKAHKIQGGAAALDITELASAAYELEQEAMTASASSAHNTDAAVWTALVALVRLLGALDVGDQALMAALTL